jgi:hypothetical protein
MISDNTPTPNLWLEDKDIIELANSLLFEHRLSERLEHIYKTYVPANGIKMFDIINARLEAVKNEIDQPLMEELNGWNKYIEQESIAGRTADTSGLPKLAELRRDNGYPVHSLFPAYHRKMSHITWYYVEERRFEIEVFRIKKEADNYKQRINAVLEQISEEPAFKNTIDQASTLRKRNTLEKCFEHTSKYISVIGLIAEHGYCDPLTCIWKDRGSGYKGLVVELIKYLHSKGFYGKEGMPKNDEIVLIAKNTFDVDLGKDTVKKVGIGQTFAFIGPASTFKIHQIPRLHSV